MTPGGFPPSYFFDRQQNNPLRLRQFALDGEFIRQHAAFSGRICDVGCSTGEFLETIGWSGQRYGMEISSYAMEKARECGFNFSRNIFSEGSFFDVVLFRGSLQHVDNPFVMLKASFDSLRPGGKLILLSFPNTRSPLYLAAEHLPFLDDATNYFVASQKILTNTLRNFGFRVVQVDFPYWRTPYRRLVYDHLAFVWNILPFTQFVPHAFWRSQLAVVAEKPASDSSQTFAFD